MSNQELKPCPFCGSEPDVITYSSYGSIHYYVRCRACEIKTRSVLAKERLPNLWNTRTPDPMLGELAESLQQMADIYYGRDNQPIAGAYAKKMDAVLQKYQQSKVEP